MGWDRAVINGRSDHPLFSLDDEARLRFEIRYTHYDIGDIHIHGPGGVAQNEAYMVLHHKETAVVTMAIVLFRGNSTFFEFKEMTENMEPFYNNCPARLLDQLTEPKNEGARRWREACRQKHPQMALI